MPDQAPQTQIEAVEGWRRAHGMNQGDFAAALGIHGSHYSEFKMGRRRLSHTALHNAYQMGVPAEVLLGYPPEVPRPPKRYKKKGGDNATEEE